MIRNYKDDYSYSKKEQCNIDMVLSGKYLDKRSFELDINDTFLDEYPSEERIEYLKEIVAKKHDKSMNNIVLGAGSNGIIQNLVKLLFKDGGELLVSEFSFAQPEYAVIRFGGKIKKIPTKSFVIDFENLKKGINSKTKAIFLCNPNNPTGYYYDPIDIIDFAKSCKIPIIVSEAAIEFSKRESLLDYDLPENVIVTRTFSKAYGLSGLRIAYGYMSGELLKLYKSSITRFEVSNVSIELAIEMLEKYDIKNNVELVINERNYLQTELEKIGIETLKSSSNAFMTKSKYHNDFFEMLNKNGIAIAKLKIDSDDSFYARIAVQTPDINRSFIEKLKEIGIAKIKEYERR